MLWSGIMVENKILMMVKICKGQSKQLKNAAWAAASVEMADVKDAA